MRINDAQLRKLAQATSAEIARLNEIADDPSSKPRQFMPTVQSGNSVFVEQLHIWINRYTSQNGESTLKTEILSALDQARLHGYISATQYDLLTTPEADYTSEQRKAWVTRFSPDSCHYPLRFCCYSSKGIALFVGQRIRIDTNQIPEVFTVVYCIKHGGWFIVADEYPSMNHNYNMRGLQPAGRAWARANLKAGIYEQWENSTKEQARIEAWQKK